MTRDDQIRATVAAGMQDSDAIREVLTDSIRESIREGDESHILIDIASAIESASRDEPFASLGYRQATAMRLLDSLECYARAALTAKAEDDIAQDDDEEDTEQ